ncbi:MAG: CcmD family protein [Cyclobacteriaceae bacterium]
MNVWKKTFYGIVASLLLTFLSVVQLLAQSADEVAMADTFRQEGKIYVVVAVMLLIFSGLIVYAIRIDQKVSKLEKELSDS